MKIRTCLANTIKEVEEEWDVLIAFTVIKEVTCYTLHL